MVLAPADLARELDRASLEPEACVLAPAWKAAARSTR
jgi:hypothetical protein